MRGWLRRRLANDDAVSQLREAWGVSKVCVGKHANMCRGTIPSNHSRLKLSWAFLIPGIYVEPGEDDFGKKGTRRS